MTIVQKQREGVTFLAAQEMDQAVGVAHGFSTRLGGVSQGMWASLNLGVSRGDDPDHVRENYRRFFAAIGAQGPRLAQSCQVHGSHVRVITQADVKEDPYEKVSYEADGLVTDLPGVTLVIFSADCLPILYYDPVRQVVGAAHAGWRGTAADIAGAVVRKMEEVYGSQPQDILAAIGPGIGACCFETHEDVPNAMMAAFSTPVLPYLHIQENALYVERRHRRQGGCAALILVDAELFGQDAMEIVALEFAVVNDRNIFHVVLSPSCPRKRHELCSWQKKPFSGGKKLLPPVCSGIFPFWQRERAAFRAFSDGSYAAAGRSGPVSRKSARKPCAAA